MMINACIWIVKGLFKVFSHSPPEPQPLESTSKAAEPEDVVCSTVTGIRFSESQIRAHGLRKDILPPPLLIFFF